MGNSKIVEKIFFSFIFSKMYAKKSLHVKKSQKKKLCRKKYTPLIWPKSKIPSIQVVQNDTCDNLYTMDFCYFINCGRYLFMEKIICGFTFHTVRRKLDHFRNCSPAAAGIKLKRNLSCQGYSKITNGTVYASLFSTLGAILPEKCIFRPKPRKNVTVLD